MQQKIVDVVFQEIDSTQTHAVLCYSEKYKGQITAVRAFSQTAGRGQYDRKWECQSKRNLMVTFIFPFFEKNKYIKDIPIVSALTVVELYAELYKLKAQVKFLNDVYINNKKQCGVLVEPKIFDEELVLFVGIGVNVDWCIEGATHLEEALQHKIDEEVLYKTLQERLLHNLTTLNKNGFEQFRGRINDVLYKKNEYNKFHDFTKLNITCEGTILEVNEEGVLLVKDENGNIKEIHSNIKI